MKCPYCGENISGLKALTAKSRVVNCGACGAGARVEGVWWFLLIPMFLFFFFPFVPLPDNLFLSISIVMGAIIFAYYAAFCVFVRIERASK